MDFKNKLRNHIVIGIISAALVWVLWITGTELNRAIAGVAFFFLFLVLIIGPVMRLWRPSEKNLPWDIPWSWRGELGIWFALLSITHAVYIFYERQGVGTLRLADYLGLGALFLTLVLAATSFEKVINFIGVSSWRWLHSFAYVIFYLVGFHVINHAFLRTGRPDGWIHWAYLGLMIVVILFQSSAFIKTVANYRKSSG